jgi:hypothetical protein
MIEYILLISFSIVFFIFAYIKLKYPFWNNQPVYHTYDYWRSFYTTPFSIYKYRPVKTKFCDFDNIKTHLYLETNKEHIDKFTDLLQCYYYSNESIVHSIQTNDLNAYLTGQHQPSFISFYNQPVYSIDSGEVVEATRHVGAISSRTVNILYRINSKDISYQETPIYYIDFLCIRRENDYKKISRKLLQTHEYNQRIKNPNIFASLIKKESDLFEGIVPFVEYKTYTFALRNINFPGMPKNIELIGMNSDNMDILFDFLHVQKNADFQYHPCLFDIFIIPDIGNLIAMIKQRLLYVFCLRTGREVLGIYFIKDAKTQFDAANGSTLQLVASISNSRSSPLFYLGFLHSLKQIMKLNREFKLIIFENIGHNKFLFQYWRDKHTPLFESKSAYYLYNFIFPGSPISPERTFLVF